jgi:hypothetical protein
MAGGDDRDSRERTREKREKGKKKFLSFLPPVETVCQCLRMAVQAGREK